MKKLTIALAVLAGLFLAGCATPETRIRQNPAAFDRATPAQQEMIKQGKVDIGFSMELVELALGVPDRTRERTDAQGKQVIWSYVNYEGPDGVILYRGWYHRGYYRGGPSYAYFADFPDRRERERFRVVFKDNKVISVEQET
jgi:hypothetical protein